MSEHAIAEARPRPESASLLRASLQLSNTYVAVCRINAAIGAFALVMMPWLDRVELWWPIFFGLYTVSFAWAGALSARPQKLLRRVWRDGERIEVTVTDFGQTTSYWYQTIVVHDGRRAAVNFRRMPERGIKIPALVLDDLIAVLEPIGRLRIGRLSEDRSE